MLAKFWPSRWSLAISFAQLLTAVPATAAEFSLNKVDSGLDIIGIRGEIESGDEDHFRRLAVGSEKAIVVLDSPGGSLAPALEIGKTIQLKGFSTYVPSNFACTSSCALIWIAGTDRYMASTAKVGFHASYRNRNGQQEEVGVGNAMVGRYLTLLNLPERAVIFATSASPNSILWLTTENSSSAGISFEIWDLDDQEGESQTSVRPAESQSSTSNENNFNWAEGVWRVWNNHDDCVVSAHFSTEGGVSNDSSIYVSVDPQGSTGRLLFANEKFQSIVHQKEYRLRIVFTKGDAIDSGWGNRTFTGYKDEVLGGALLVSLDWNDLRKDMLNSDTVEFIRNEKLIDSFPLSGSAKALKQLDLCLGVSRKRQLVDPFAQ